MSNTTTIKFDKKSLTRGLSGGALITSAVVAMNTGALCQSRWDYSLQDGT